MKFLLVMVVKMNSRILKKLCRRAEKYTEAFQGLERVDDGCNDPVSIRKFDRKHKEKWCRPKIVSSNYIQFLFGTPSYGGMSGYYEQEWEDTPAYFILLQIFQDQFIEWGGYGYKYKGPKNPTPSMVFKHFGI